VKKEAIPGSRVERRLLEFCGAGLFGGFEFLGGLGVQRWDPEPERLDLINRGGGRGAGGGREGGAVTTQHLTL
jgi:hypothetical protein